MPFKKNLKLMWKKIYTYLTEKYPCVKRLDFQAGHSTDKSFIELEDGITNSSIIILLAQFLIFQKIFDSVNKKIKWTVHNHKRTSYQNITSFII